MSDSISTEDKIEKIIKENADMIYRIAYQNVKNKSDAEDIFQDVCMQLVTKNAPINDNIHIKYWLIRVTVNKCKNFHKSAWRRKTESIDDHINLQASQSEYNEVLEEIWQLPTDYRNIIYLYYYEDYTIAEIAQILGKNQNTIRSRLQRARKKLKNIMLDGSV